MQGTVRGVDDIGTIMVNWDNGSSLGVAYGEDAVERLVDTKEEWNMGNDERYFIENGRLYYADEFFGVYEVTCTVESFLHILSTEGYLDDKED